MPGQEGLPPDLRQYLKKVGSVDGVQRGVAAALGKKGESGLDLPLPDSAPRLPVPGAQTPAMLCCMAGAHAS